MTLHREEGADGSAACVSADACEVVHTVYTFINAYIYVYIQCILYVCRCFCCNGHAPVHLPSDDPPTPPFYPSPPLPSPWPLRVALSNPPPPPGKQVSQNRMIDMLQIFWLFGWVALTITLLSRKVTFFPYSLVRVWVEDCYQTSWDLSRIGVLSLGDFMAF